MKKLKLKLGIALGIILCTAIGAFFTNPSLEEHEAIFNEECKKINPVMGVVSSFFKDKISYDNRFIFSYSTVGGKTFGIGAFNYVYVSMDLEEEMKLK